MAEIDPVATLENEPPTNKLFVGGQFSSVDGSLLSASNIASWNGNSWNILGSNSTNNGVMGGASVYALVVFVPNIFHELPSQDAILLAEIDVPSTFEK